MIAPGHRRGALRAAILAATIAFPALTAHAAEPDAPERLAAQAAGVVGSGDQLSLRLTEDGKERTIRLGDDYANGWKLDKLTPTSATLIRDGERREVGLNPSGALANKAPAAPASVVRVDLSDEELLALVLKDKGWDGKTPHVGLTLEETKRWYILAWKSQKLMDAYQDEMNARAQRAGLGQISLSVHPYDGNLFLLGAQAPEFAALLNKVATAADTAGAAAFERYGPIEVKVGPPRPVQSNLDGSINPWPELAQYPGALFRATQIGDDGGAVMVMRPPDPTLTHLYSTEPNPPNNGSVKLMYRSLDSKPGDYDPGVEGPEPPP